MNMQPSPCLSIKVVVGRTVYKKLGGYLHPKTIPGAFRCRGLKQGNTRYFSA